MRSVSVSVEIDDIIELEWNAKNAGTIIIIRIY